MSGHQYFLVHVQWKTETDMRLPTWLRLGVKNVGNGILGYTKENTQAYERIFEIPKITFEIQKIYKEPKKIAWDTKDKEAALQ